MLRERACSTQEVVDAGLFCLSLAGVLAGRTAKVAAIVKELAQLGIGERWRNMRSEGLPEFTLDCPSLDPEHKVPACGFRPRNVMAHLVHLR